MTGIGSGSILMLGGSTEDDSALGSVLAAAGFELVVAESDEDVMNRAATERPVAVLIDLDENGTSGYLVCKLLRERQGDLLPIVLMSGKRREASDRVVGLLLGADDYLVKPLEPSEIVARLRRLVARSTVARREPSAPPRATVDGFDLTTRERQVMTLLLVGLTQDEIARKLVISSNTVATHIQRILLKLGVHNRAQAVAKVARAGWLRTDAETGSLADALGAAVSREVREQPT